MKKKKQFSVLILIVLFVVLNTQISFGSTTGKIAGVVEDAKSGMPIPGATIQLNGTESATQTDIDGEYFFINVPAGSHTVLVSIIGFQPIQKENVRVLLDLTTPIDFELDQVEIPLKRRVEVVATRKPIQKDLTATRSTITSDRISFIPNGLSVQNIISNMAGTVVDDRANLHIRGGRSGTVSYFYDGFSVQDPFFGTVGMRIVPEALEEINLTSGGFPAEYGEALSGIVNSVTKEGTRSYHGKIKFYEGATNPYNVYRGTWRGLTRNGNNGLSYNLSGPTPFINGFKSTFFLAGEYLMNNGYLPHNDQTQYSQMGKFSMQPSPSLKLTLIGNYNSSEGETYTHRDNNNISYDFNLDGLPVYKRLSYLYGLKGSYQHSQKTILDFSYNHFYTETKFAPEHLFDVYWDQWPGYSEDANGVYNGTIHEDNYVLSQDYFYTGFTTGDDFAPRYQKSSTDYDAISMTLTSQINKHNQLRFGGEYRLYDLFWDQKQFYNLQPYGEKYSQSPVYAMTYFQNKMEFEDFIINAGLRYDYLNSEVYYWPDVIEKDTPKIRASSKTQISPRLGVSHPISDRSIIRFNYGYFFQIPNFSDMYMNLDANLNSGLPLVGNPDLEAEKTIAYELGLNHMLSDDVRLAATVYYKDIKNLISTREIGRYGDSPITQFVNEDYGSVKGIDITIEKVARGNLSGSLAYSYMIARGNLSDPYDGYNDYITNTTDSIMPVMEYPLAFDQKHTATLNLSYRVPRDWEGNLFGMTVPGAWGLDMIGHYGSGLPYTVTNELGEREGGLNEARLPANFSVDMRFNKDVFVNKDNLFFSFFVEIQNLFNRRNVLSVYSNNGRSDDDGRRAGSDPDGDGPYTEDDANRYYHLMAHDPQNFSAPRTFRVGLEFNF
ncbi:MAG: TonB-dependent receptor [candidate division Zixibacteria bacterium]|nr:TonB-dependent receptor [candidate division Zixibacteria bacterium]